MADLDYELWINQVLNTDPPEFVFYAAPPGEKVIAFTSPLLSRPQALAVLALSERELACASVWNL